MALFPNTNDTIYSGETGKTHTGLVVSEGNAPAEQFIVSRENASTPFIYEYGPEGNQNVLIAKGKIVEGVGLEKNRETGFAETAIKVAEDGTTKAIGVNHHNVYEQRRGAMEGNRPTVITRNYIEVPLFEHDDIETAASSAVAMHFGAAYGKVNDLQPGDYVVAGADGNFRKFVDGEDGDSVLAIVGQVLGASRELPPAGLLQYYTGLQENELGEYLKTISATGGAADSIHPYGSPYTVGSWRKDFVEALGGGNLKGIPFLTDGYFSAKEQIEVVLGDDTHVEAVRPGDGVTVDGGAITLDQGVEESMVVVKLKHDIDHRNLAEVSAEVGGEKLNARDVHVDVANNSIVIYLQKDAADLTISVPAIVNPTAGIPTEWDHKGSVGAVRILLQK